MLNSFMRNQALFICFLSIFLGSCVSHNKLIYLNENVEEGTKPKVEYYNEYLSQNYRVRSFDQLAIKVASYEENSISFFNSGSASQPGNANSAILYLNSYTVNESGMLQLPLLGEVQVGGLTITELQDTLNSKLAPFLNMPTVSVKLANFNITVLGEVARPGLMPIYNTKTTLLQVLGMAGDLSDYGNREKIKFMRETGGKIETTYLDLTDPNLISSDYFFLLPNDVIYVEPIKAKAFSLNLKSVSLGLSVTSIVLTITNIIISSQKNP